MWDNGVPVMPFHMFHHLSMEQDEWAIHCTLGYWVGLLAAGLARSEGFAPLMAACCPPSACNAAR